MGYMSNILVNIGLLFTYIHTRHDKSVKFLLPVSIIMNVLILSACMAHCMNQRSRHLLEMCEHILYSLAMVLYFMANLAGMAHGSQLCVPLDSDLILSFAMFLEFQKVILFI